MPRPPGTCLHGRYIGKCEECERRKRLKKYIKSDYHKNRVKAIRDKLKDS